MTAWELFSWAVIIGACLLLLWLVFKTWMDGRKELEADEHEIFPGL